MKSTAARQIEQTPPPERVTLANLARDTLAEFNGDTESATAALISRLENERWLLQAVAEDAINYAVAQSIQKAHRAERPPRLSTYSHEDGSGLGLVSRKTHSETATPAIIDSRQTSF